MADSSTLPFGKSRKPEYPVAERRRYLTRGQKKAVIDRQGGKCAGCGIKAKRWELDHVSARWKGQVSQTDIDNWQAFGHRSECGCHKAKTADEARDRARMKRLQGRTGQAARRAKSGSKLKSRNTLRSPQEDQRGSGGKKWPVKPKDYVSPLSREGRRKAMERAGK